ncbi:MAG: hypothetical protein Fur0018_06910 [Anaerolineales bacterium]
MNTELKHILKRIRWQARRGGALLRWGPRTLWNAPAVLGNAIPKSGSHLIIQVLQGLTAIGPFVDGGFPPVNRAEDNRKLPDSTVLRNIRRMRAGDIGYGYVGCYQPFIDALTAPGRATIFVYRDPRDAVVSSVFYATDMNPGHAMHRYYNENLDSVEARINVAIRGLDDPDLPYSGVRQRFEKYLGWLEQPGVLCLRFEDLQTNREAAFNRILDYLEGRGWRNQPAREESLRALHAAIQPRKSGTYRKGKPGGWREHFTEANKAIFKEEAGDLLIRLGYEKDTNW